MDASTDAGGAPVLPARLTTANRPAPTDSPADRTADSPAGVDHARPSGRTRQTARSRRAVLLSRLERALRNTGLRWWEWAVALGAVATVNTAVALDAVAPVQTKDEIGYLMAGRLLGGGGAADLIMPPYAGGYSAGWGLLLAPAWPLAGGPVGFMHAGVAMNVLLATVAVVVWAAVARRLGAAPRAALLVAAIVAVAPGRALYTGYALPEALIGLLVALAFWLVLRLWEVDGPVAGRTGTALALAGTASYLSLVHSRFLPTVAVLVLVLAWWAWRARTTTAVVVAGAAAAGVLGSVLLNRWVEDALYGEVDRFSAAGEQVGQLHIGFMTSLTIGHAWYGAVAWAGTTLVGALWAARFARREWRRRAPGPFTVLLLLTAGQLLVGAFYLSTRVTVGAGRLDQVVYGRYTDPVWALLAVIGLSVLLSGRADRVLLRRALVLVGLLGVAVGIVLFAVGGIVGGLVQLNVPGIEMWRWDHDGELRVPWVQATAAAMGVLVAALWLRARSVPAAVLVLVLAVMAVSGTFVAEHRNIDARDERLRDLFTMRETVEQYPNAPLMLVVDRPLLLTGTAFQYWLGDREYRVVDPKEEALKAQPCELVIAARYPRPLIIGAQLELRDIDPTGRYTVSQAACSPGDPRGLRSPDSFATP